MVEKTLGFMFFLKHGRKLENKEMYIYLEIPLKLSITINSFFAAVAAEQLEFFQKLLFKYI
nr:hypothetical protein [Mucilaginibacter sp. L294]